MKRVHPNIRQFLDLEAQVDEEENEDEQEEEARRELEETFIDDDDDEGHSSQFATPSTVIRSREAEEERETQNLQEIMERAVARAAEDRLLSSSDSSQTTFTQEAIAYRPRDGDYPLWKVDCRVGIEESAVFSLMNTVRPQHEVRSAFTRGSVRGAIYIESTMNQHLIALLKITPGIIHRRDGVHRQMVEQCDYVDTLKMKNLKVDVVVDDWVLVKRGLYKGDIALVKNTKSWGAQVLLVPRLHPTSNVTRKRKASLPRPKAQLFNPEAFRHSPKFITWDGPDSYNLGPLTFADGLLEKNYDYHSLEKGVIDIPYEHFLMFKQTRTVKPQNMLRPREWCIQENDRVVITSKNEKAVVMSVHPFYCEVECGDPLRDPLLVFTVHVPWQNVKKDIKIGDYVRGGGGAWTGQAGWVVEVKEEFVSIAKKKVEGAIVEHDNVVEYVDILINSVVVTDPPHQLHHPPLANSEQLDINTPILTKVRRHPWCGTNVVISRRYHPRKGETGEVKEVTSEQNGKVIKLVLQLTRYKPSEPFKNITVDYEEVVELTTLKKLDNFLNPGLGHIRPWGAVDEPVSDPSHPDYVGRREVWDPRQQNFMTLATPLPSPPTPSPSHSPNNECETPSYSGDTPWWDPSSRTPMPEAWLPAFPPLTRTLDATPTASGSSRKERSGPSKPTTVLTNPKLAGVTLSVLVNGGGFSNKELSATISVVEDRIVVRTKRYNSYVLLEPEWLSPKHPSPTHDNGLLVVIQGDHCGKYARRIHHHHSNGSTSIVVGIVTKCEGIADNLTAEKIELEPEDLCTVQETKAQKDLNRNLMTQIRKEHQHLNR